MESIWENSIEIKRREPLEGNVFTEVAVIGAGMTGILTAHYLQERGFHVVVLEADRIGSGQTKHTTAKITSQHGLFYDGLLNRLGEEKAGLYARANEEAISEYEKLIRERDIACHFERLPAYLYTAECQKSPADGGQGCLTEKAEQLKREAQAAARLGIKASFTKETTLPFAVQGAVRFEEQAQFHPLEFIRELSVNLTIYEQTKVLKVKKNKIFTNRGVVRADAIIFATHYPILNAPGFYFLRQHQERSYVITVEGVKPLDGMYYSIDKDGLSLRSIGDTLLLGGGAERTGRAEAAAYDRAGRGVQNEWEKSSRKQAVGAYDFLKQAAAVYYPENKVTACWSAQDCMPHDGLPFIGKYSVFRPDWYVATGYKKWGMTTSMIAARILCDAVCGIENPYAGLFSPMRLHGFGCAAFCKDALESTAGLFKGAFHMPLKSAESLLKGEGGIVRIGLRRYACYRDMDGVLHRMSAKCPHMGCELAWNPEEKSFDCPCHGSRFSCDGELLDNPAQIDRGKRDDNVPYCDMRR